MKLVTYETKGKYNIGVIVEDRILDLNKAMGTNHDMVSFLETGVKGLGLVKDAIKDAKTSNMYRLEDVKLAAPIPRTRKNIVCLGLNYAEHVKEGASGAVRPLPKHPIYFTKPPTSITGPYDPVIYHKAITRLDYEVELAFVIGKKGINIPKEKVYDHIAGYMVFQDISARQLQSQHLQWYRGKSLDTFAPMGPYLVTPDEVGDPMDLDIWCKVNGETRQSANTSDLIFDLKTIVSTLSDGITLEVSDVFATGTPSGVGSAHPLGLLKVGDIIESGIEKIGILRNEVISSK
jgi:2-keto-4-pentenoate hydratase/2-oxohepta-3-ene-1,7-dioic acid hydratase in catechol pathway